MQIDWCDPYLDHFGRSSNSRVDNKDTLAISKAIQRHKLNGIDEDNVGFGMCKYLPHPQTAPGILRNAATTTLLPT
jgi:homoserine acetyltransferase